MQSTCVCDTYKMEYDKINNLLDSESENLSKFVTRDYVKVNSLSNTYNENESIRFETPMLSSNLCDYADAYTLVNGTIQLLEINLDVYYKIKLVLLYLLSMIQKYTFQLLLCQKKIIKILLNNKIKDFKDLFIGMNIKQNNKLKMLILILLSILV